MWFDLPRQYVSLRTASAFCDARAHIGKEAVEVRGRLNFTIWRVADVCLSQDRDAIEVHYELVMGPGKDFVESFYEGNTWKTSFLSQFARLRTEPYPLINYLRAGDINVSVVLERGRLENLDRTYWWIEDNILSWCPEKYDDDCLSTEASNEFDLDDERPDEVRLWDKKIPGKMFVEKAELERLFPPNRRLMEAAEAGPQPESYTSPYLLFMIRAAAELDLAPEKRTKKEAIEAWLRDDWPAELGEASQEKVRYMATFLRSPAHEKGGNFRNHGAAAGSSKGSEPSAAKM